MTAWYRATPIATMAHPGHLHDVEAVHGEIGMRLRDLVRGDFMWWTHSTAPNGEVAVGASFLDRRDAAHDEDNFLLDSTTGQLESLYGTDLERRHRAYRGTHHGDKAHLNCK
jgi:hypothetical protein